MIHPEPHTSETVDCQPRELAPSRTPNPAKTEGVRPFRLVKYFSFTGFTVILVFILGLTIFISSQAKTLVLKKSTDYAVVLANNLNHQVFQQFVLPTAIRFGQIRLRETFQYNLLDAVVQGTLHSLNVERLNIYDLEGMILYSTDKKFVGEKLADKKNLQQALSGQHSSVLDTGNGGDWIGFGKAWTLRTFYPFRGEKPVKGAVGEVLGVFEIHQNLTDDYIEIVKFQYLSIAISLAFTSLLFVILRKILVRGERIIEARNEERRRLEEKLHHSERLAILGQMVASVSHEIRNPLGIISSTAEILEKKIRQYEPNHRLAGVIVEEARRLNGIVTEFLDFARPQIPKPEPCRLDVILDRNLDFLAPTLEQEHIEVIRDYRAPEEIEADPDLLYRAFLNVFVNAIQAMPEGGWLRVSTLKIPRQEGNGPAMIQATITDNGAGIDPAQAEALFTPFFTTKNRGSGLGLAIVKNIVDGHHGQVAIEPAETGGARVIVRVPVSQN